MLKFNRVICLLLVCTCIGVVYAKATKIFIFVNVNAGVDDNPDGDGVVIIKYSEVLLGTTVQISMSGFVPDTEYFVAMVPGFSSVAVSSNAAGNFQLRPVVQFDVIEENPNPCVIIWRDDDDDGNRAHFVVDGVVSIFGPEDRSFGCVE